MSNTPTPPQTLPAPDGSEIPIRRLTAEANARDIHGPEPVALLRCKARGGGDVMDYIDGFIVPGTNGVWGVYVTDTSPHNWTLTHVPTGLAAKRECGSRDMAEAIACWMHCQTVSHANVQADNGDKAVEGLGPRTKAFMASKQPFRACLQFSRKGMVRHKAAAAPHEAELAALRYEWEQQLAKDRRLLSIAESDLEARLADVQKQEKSLAARERQLEQRHEHLEAMSAQVAVQQSALAAYQRRVAEYYDQNMPAVAEARNAVFAAERVILAMISAVTAAGEAGANGASVAQRQLRKIHVKLPALPLPPPAPSTPGTGSQQSN
jgi:hypothetical protein